MTNEGREVNAELGRRMVREVARCRDNGWIAEIAIPFQDAEISRTPVQTWGMNFQQTLRRRNEDALWAACSAHLQHSARFLAGALEGLEGIEPGANIKIKPVYDWEASRRALHGQGPE